MKDLYMFRFTQTARRSGEHIGVMVGVVVAATIEEAESKVWERYSSDTTCSFDIWQLPVDEISAAYTVYRSEI